jgi:hypothetical protein
MRSAYKILAGKCEGKVSRGNPTCKWDNNIKIDITDKLYEDDNWIRLVRDGVQTKDLVNAGSVKIEEFIE